MRARQLTELFCSALVAVAFAGSGMFSAGTATAAYVDEVVNQNPLLYWRLNDSAAGTLVVHHNPTPITTNAGISGAQSVGFSQSSAPALRPSGGAAGFEESNTWLHFPGDAAGQAGNFIATLTGNNQMTSAAGSASFWIRTANGVTGDPEETPDRVGRLYTFDSAIPTTTTNSFGTVYTFIDRQGQLGLRIGTDIRNESEVNVFADIRSTGAYNDGQWHHVVATWNVASNQAFIHIDGGTLAGGETVSGVYSTPDVSFGNIQSGHRFAKGRNNATYYVGDADELAIWNRTLTAAEAQAQYLAAAIPEPASLSLLVLGAGLLMRRRR